jgi:hypothetical protein
MREGAHFAPSFAGRIGSGAASTARHTQLRPRCTRSNDTRLRTSSPRPDSRPPTARAAAELVAVVREKMQMLKMRPSIWGCLPVAFAVAIFAGQARASSVSFGDATKYWQGYSNGTVDDTRDTIGTPDFLGGTATFDDATGYLTGVSINYTGYFSPVASGNARVIPGDLFLDVGSDGHWDYVVKLVAGSQTPVANYASLSILDVSAIASPSYLMSGSDNNGYWAGYGIRDRHPYAWDGGGTPVGTGSLTGFNQLASGGTLVFGLGIGLPMSSNLTISFAPSCANDVLRETVSAPVPEPTGALIFGIGLAAVSRGQRALRRA